MDISVIIVSYNVRAFLEKCLESVYRSRGNLDVEVIVVDNDSIDDSVRFVREIFPEVKLIVNVKFSSCFPLPFSCFTITICFPSAFGM